LKSDLKNYLVLLAGVFGAASSVFFIKASRLEPATLSAVRLLAAAAILSPFALIQLRRAGIAPSWRGVAVVLPAALPLAVHYLTWFRGVRLTSAAMSTLIVNLTPVFMPFLVWGLLRERINRGELIGSLVAIAGVVVLTLGKDRSGQTTTAGILICIGSIGLCTLYLALGRKYARGRSLLAYIVPLYCVAGLVGLAGAFALHEPLPPITLREIAVALGAVIFPTVIGHTALNYAMVHLPSQVVSCSSLGQFVFVAILAMPIYGEYPTWNLLLPAVLVLGGSLIVIRAATPKVRQSIEVATIEPAGT
jgi:drug/metabolite transporter (DMT)-like permease